MKRMVVCALGVLAVGCTGDDSTVRSFHSTVAPGSPLVAVVLGAEEAQKPGAHLTVAGMNCPADRIEIARTFGNPYIRVTQRPSTPDPDAEPAYTEVGHATREEFRRAVTTRLPSFFGCRRFAFRFGRDQVWPATDSFTVDVDDAGRITLVSDVKKDDLGE